MSRTYTPQELALSLDMLLVATLWQQVHYGYPPYTPNLSHVGGVHVVTRDGFDTALNIYSHIAQEMAEAGITRDQAWAAVPALAPWATFADQPADPATAVPPMAIQLVGSGWSPGVMQDFSGAGA